MTTVLTACLPPGSAGDPLAPHDLVIENGVIADIRPAAVAPAGRLLALPALANAHDHCRPLSPTSFGAAGKPLETWLLRLGVMPAVDPYLGAKAAFARAARAGAGSVMAHYTRLHGPMSPVEEAREIARAAADVGVRVTLALFMRDRNPLVYGDAKPLLDQLEPEARASIEAAFFAPTPSIADQIARVEAVAAAVESETFTVQFGPNGAQWCSDELLAAIGEASRRSGRRIHIHLLETKYQRAFADAAYPEGLTKRLAALGFLSERVTLAHCVHARPEELDDIAAAGAVIATNPSSNLHLRSGVAPIGEAIKRGCRVAIGVDASAFDEDDDILREMRLGHFLHGGWGFDEVVGREDWLNGIVANGRFANGAPGDGALKVGAPADILLLDLDRLDRDRVMPVEPVDLLFARAHAAHVEALYVAGRPVVSEGRLARVDFEATHEALRAQYRERVGGRAAFARAFAALEPLAQAFYRNGLSCC
jgi:cytosine/adenosine deaminase-related metal-dependent hydrolase